jgi:hypothetical protein
MVARQSSRVGNKMGTGLAISAQCGCNVRASGQYRICFAIKALKYHRNVFPIPRVWQTYRTQNPVLASGCGFKSHIRYSPVGQRTKPTGCVNAPSFSERTQSSSSAQQSSSSRRHATPSAYKYPATPTETGTGLLPEKLPTDPDLATVINAWNRLPEAVRAGIVAMVKTTSGKGS